MLAETGKLLWSYEWSELFSRRQATDPLIMDRKVFVTDFSAPRTRFECVLIDIGEKKPKLI
jgi:hypothetical protein